MKNLLFYIIIGFIPFCKLKAQNKLIYNKNGQIVQFHMSKLEPFDTLNPLHEPKYRIFMIFGDGNYYRGTRFSPIPPNSESPVIRYTYDAAGTYQAKAYLTEIYSNAKPPEDGESQAMVTVTGSGQQGSSQVDFVSSPTKIGIDTNHYNRPDYNTVYVISSEPDISSKYIFFFYGSLRTQGVFAPVSNAYKHIATHLADYSMSGNLTRISAAEFDGGISNFHSEFDSVLVYKLSNAETALFTTLENTIEHRIFHVLQTDTSVRSDTVGRFLAVLAGTDSNHVNTSNPDWGYMNGLLNNASLPPIDYNELYVQDFAKLNAVTVAQHDPNVLRPIVICKCNEEGKLRISYELSFCNDGKIPTSSIDVKLTDLEDVFSCWHLISIDKGSLPAQPADPNAHSISFNLPINLLGKPEINKLSDRCATLRFSVTVEDKASWKKLTSNGLKMEACIAFDNMSYQCVSDTLICSERVNLRTHKLSFHENLCIFEDCPDTCMECEDYCDWRCRLLTAAGLLMIVLLVYFRKRF